MEGSNSIKDYDDYDDEDGDDDDDNDYEANAFAIRHYN